MRKPLGICIDNTEQTLAFAGWDLSVLPEGLWLLRLRSSEWSELVCCRTEKQSLHLRRAQVSQEGLSHPFFAALANPVLTQLAATKIARLMK